VPSVLCALPRSPRSIRRRLAPSIVVALLVSALHAAAQAPPARGSKPVKESPLFPSLPVWTIQVSSKPVAPPLAAGDRVFLALESGLTARRVSDGSEIWTKPIHVEGSMAASADRLVLQSKGELFALDAASGDPVWSDQFGPLTAAPLVHEDHLLVATGEHLTLYQLADGVKTWTNEGVGAVEQRPAVAGVRVYVPAADGRIVALELGSGTQVWEHQVGIKPTEPLVVGDRIYVGSGAKWFYCLRALDGKENWVVDVGAAVAGAAVADEQHVYFVAFDNLLRAHDSRSGNRKWRAELKNRPSAGPVLVGTNVTAPSKASALEAFNTTTGKPAGNFTLPEALVDVPVFIVPPDGKPAKVLVLAGGLKNVWTLTLAESPPPPLPVLRVTPLSVLPGQAIPRGALPVHPGLPLPAAERPPQFEPASAPRTTTG
jgi:outer membrane protein assembly factor BamB